MIYIMMKPASGKCNMHCSYCFYKDEISKREIPDYGFMNEKTLEQIIRKAIGKASKECTFAYQGGEPTLAGIEFFEKSIEFQKKYNTKGIHIQNVIQTNGYSLNEKWCEFFLKNKFLVGVSVDGIKYTHDKYRKSAKGEDSYFTIIQNIEMLEAYGVDYNILTVVNKTTANKVDKIFESYMKKGYQYQQYIPCMEPLEEDGQVREYSINATEYGVFLGRLFELWEIACRQGNRIYIRQFENWFTILKGGIPEACEQRGICGVQTIIEADGSVYPCDFYALDEYRIGNINENTLEEIDEKRKEMQFLEMSYNHAPECLECKYFKICRGNCNRYRMYGKHRLCEGFYYFFEQKYMQLLQMAEMLQ
ncbi:MAG: anaerobic sulfatase maturase [Lachnospiraceae bacterium]|nr:anaerobic sulfatase maturase [Lachnospiraceae bacterium]